MDVVYWEARREEAARSGMEMWAGGNMKGMLEVSRSGTVREEQA